MKRPCRILTIVCSLFASAPLAQVAAEECRSIRDDIQRLACYDDAFGAPAAESASDGPPLSALERREKQVRGLQRNWFALTPHRPNYMLPFTYVHNADFSPYSIFGNTRPIDQKEAKYQVSVSTLLWPKMFGSKLDTWFAFTLQSYWQVYASDISSPFRENNYEPEFFVSMPLRSEVLGWNLRRADFGISHQSNGRGEPLSRSWNRLFGQLLLDRGNFALTARAWWRIPESDREDDNPHIERYMGQGELGGAYRWGNQTFALLIKNNFRHDNKSGVQFDWSLPLTHHVKGYVQLYSGYGENLIDGPNNQTRAGLGLMITDWL
jgi:phospholipase A1